MRQAINTTCADATSICCLIITIKSGSAWAQASSVPHHERTSGCWINCDSVSNQLVMSRICSTCEIRKAKKGRHRCDVCLHPVGTCPLCLQIKTLIDSHLLPRSLYALLS